MQKSNHSIYYCLLILCFFSMAVVLVSCAVSQPSALGNDNTTPSYSVISTADAIDISPSVTQPPSETPVATVTVARLPSMTPTVMASITPVPSNTPTITFTPLPTLISLPTIPPQQRGKVYADLMGNNGGCALPCWWGFELGKTSIDEVRQLYESFGANISEQDGRDGISVLEAQFVDPQIENGTQVRHIFVAEEDVLIEALTEIVFDSNYQITPLLQRLGYPSDIWMWTIPELYEGVLPARFRLYFPERGVLALYATSGTKVNNTVHVCFEEIGGVILLLWEPEIWDTDGTKGIVDRSNQGGSAFTLEGFPIDEVSNWDVEQFFTILSDPAHSECLETPSNLWSLP